MRHFAVHEWGRVKIGEGASDLTRSDTNRLTAAAAAHRLGGDEGTNIINDHHRYVRVRQCVGVLAAAGVSLEILPKVDPEASDVQIGGVRAQLLRMLDAAWDLGLSEGEIAPLTRQETTLLDCLIRIFTDRLIAQVRRGLPRAYYENAHDVTMMRGRLDLVRQFTVHSVRPDRLACRFDELSSDTPLAQIMRASVVFLAQFARSHEAQRRLFELRVLMREVSEVAVGRLPWASIQIDRSNRRWRTLYDLSKLLLARDWQTTCYDAHNAGPGVSLLFPMNDLFEATVAAGLRKALTNHDIDVVVQGGHRYCLGEWQPEKPCYGDLFQTKPDILVRSHGKVILVVDTKWKCLRDGTDDRKRGISQADVYQLMAYAQLYNCDRLLMLYPHHAGLSKEGVQANYGVAVPGKMQSDRLQVATIDVGKPAATVVAALRQIVLDAA
jgi:5-methylcytosine-specific restriction enzyme subunit McrC